MLFRKKMPRACIYCANGTALNDEQILCAKRGLVPRDAQCRKFKYAPCKRIPSKPKVLDFSQYDERDFSL